MRHRRGSAMIEASLSLLLLLMLTLAIVDCGRYLYAANLLPYLAREGARYASLHGPEVEPAAVQRHVEKFIAGLPADSVKVDIQVDAQTPAVTVRTLYTFTPAASVVLGRSVPVSGQARLALAVSPVKP